MVIYRRSEQTFITKSPTSPENEPCSRKRSVSVSLSLPVKYRGAFGKIHFPEHGQQIADVG